MSFAGFADTEACATMVHMARAAVTSNKSGLKLKARLASFYFHMGKPKYGKIRVSFLGVVYLRREGGGNGRRKE